jgi:hypothetical protein
MTRTALRSPPPRRIGDDEYGGLYATAQIKTDATTARTLSDDDHGYILDFTSGSAVTVTVPAGLRPGFCCAISQGGAGKVTVAAGAGTTVNVTGGLLGTEAQYVMLQLIQFAGNAYRLYGRTA